MGSPTFTLPVKWIGLLITAIGVSGGAAWQIRGDRIAELETRNATLKLADDKDLSDLLKSLRTASKELARDVVMINEIPNLRKEVDGLKKRNGELDTRLVENQTKLEDTLEVLAVKEALLAELLLHQEQFTLKVGNSRTFVVLGITVGLVHVDITGKIEITLNGERMDLLTGGIAAIKQDDKTIKVIVENVDWGYSRASFLLVVTK